MSVEPWWVAFLRWHVDTEHPWDAALTMEAMSMGVDGVARAIGEALIPAFERAAESMRALLAAWPIR